MNILREIVYGCTVFDKRKFSRAYVKHVRAVRKYFKNKPDKLLVVDITKGNGWEKICPFLGKEIPNDDFPHSNKTQRKVVKKSWVDRLLNR